MRVIALMIAWHDLPLLGLVSAFSAFVGSVAGSGGSTILLPVLVLYYGVHDAVPILTIANFSANVSRMIINRREIVFPVVGWFVLGSFRSVSDRGRLGLWPGANPSTPGPCLTLTARHIPLTGPRTPRMALTF